MISAHTPPAIDLTSPLRLASAFRFPLQSVESRRDVLVGALWLLVPGIGWILNMGHRIAITHSMQHGERVWPAWRNYPVLARDGIYTFLGMVEYHLPSVLVECAVCEGSCSSRACFSFSMSASGSGRSPAIPLPMCSTDK